MLRCFCLSLAIFTLASAAQAQDNSLLTAWHELLSADEAKATKAALAFAAKPKESVEFLTAKLRPLKAEPKLFARLVAELGDKDYKTREAAQVELEYFGKYIKGDLEKASKEESNPEAKERLGKLLGRIDAVEKEEKIKNEKNAPTLGGGKGGVSISNNNGQVTIIIDGKKVDLTPKIIEKLPPPPTWTRAARAIGILEFLGTPDAVKLLEALSLGEDTAPPTKQAQDALARLKRKK